MDAGTNGNHGDSLNEDDCCNDDGAGNRLNDNGDNRAQDESVNEDCEDGCIVD